MKGPTYWRAPRWAPLWVRRIFRGRWTQAEIDDIEKRAHDQWAEFQRYIE